LLLIPVPTTPPMFLTVAIPEDMGSGIPQSVPSVPRF
jgi:hypothetical protein